MKILCIDGGGIRGVFAIEILQAMEEEFQQPIGDLFDVVAGTSTGAIIAAAVSLNKKMDEIQESYKVYSSKIFKPQAKLGLFKTVYSDRHLRLLLKKAFGELTLDDIKNRYLFQQWILPMENHLYIVQISGIMRILIYRLKFGMQYFLPAQHLSIFRLTMLRIAIYPLMVDYGLITLL